VDMPDAVPSPTLYTRWGDWFPPAMGVLLLVILAGGLVWRRRR
jgi:LPXTG-motif cell wall-anchored protein